MAIEPPVWCWRCLIAAWWCDVDGAYSLPVLLSALPPYCRSRRAVELRWSKASVRVASGLSPPLLRGRIACQQWCEAPALPWHRQVGARRPQASRWRPAGHVRTEPLRRLSNVVVEAEPLPGAALPRICCSDLQTASPRTSVARRRQPHAYN